jgi:GGDEF domain-containing protein
LGVDEAIAAAALVEVTEVVLALVDARRQAASDELTGCLSRRAGLTRLGEELERSRRTHAPVSCVMLDLDNLKQINDTFGHLEAIESCARPARASGASSAPTIWRLATAAMNS